VVTPQQRRAVVTDACARRPLSVRRACRYLGIHRPLVQDQSRAAPQEALRARLGELAVAKPRWGSTRLTWRLRREGWAVNHKRIERLVRDERLLVGQRTHADCLAFNHAPYLPSVSGEPILLPHLRGRASGLSRVHLAKPI
jgi:putative transposase